MTPNSMQAAKAQLDAKVLRLAPAHDDGVVLVQGSTIHPEPVNWLWEGWLALGKFCVLAGPPGCGKTTIALACAATVTSGGRWPDGSRCPRGTALIWSGEDDPADTLLPRLIAAGADTSRVYFVTGSRIAGEVLPFDPARDLTRLTAQAEAIGNVRLLVVDPVVSAVTGDGHKNTEVRRALQPLVDLGGYLGAAVLGISHFSKGTGGKDPTERVTGSVAFGAVARIVMVAAKVTDESGEPRRIFARSKSNIGPDDGGFEYSLEQVEAVPGISASRVLWGNALPGSARDLLREADEDATDPDGGSESGVNAFLRSLLQDGPVAAKSIKADADGAGYAWRTVQRAADRMGVERRKLGLREGWVWALTEQSDIRRRHEGAEDANSGEVAPSAPSVTSSDDGESF